MKEKRFVPGLEILSVAVAWIAYVLAQFLLYDVVGSALMTFSVIPVLVTASISSSSRPFVLRSAFL